MGAAMWLRGQNLEKPVFGTAQRKWYFQIWSGDLDGLYVQRVFFWDEEKSHTGLIEFREPNTLHIRKIKQQLAKIAKDATYRKRFALPLKFPLQRYW
jgi:hypothetical protein